MLKGNTHLTSKYPTSKSQAGFTLVEIMISVGLLGLSGFGLVTGLLQSRQMAEAAIHQSTALTIAQGYVEQIKNMEFDSLDESILPTLFHEGASDTLTVSPTPANPNLGNSNTDILNSKSIDINNTTDDQEDDMNMDIVVYVDDITDESNGIGEARRVILKYEYIYKDGYRTHTEKNILYSVRSEVPTY
ncbi:MAG: prepilin-type N-terminal cleavage/methylation domain-containing protein [Opitutaceae bacterium]|nr:prepilin-type N-terminal cleavage/methylation domain-containing protein [Opitutaceae bacterium]